MSLGQQLVLWVIVAFVVIKLSQLMKPLLEAARHALARKSSKRVLNKRCGTCEWWEPKMPPSVGVCKSPIPDCMETCFKDYPMLINDGTTCPCWKAKESEGE